MKFKKYPAGVAVNKCIAINMKNEGHHFWRKIPGPFFLVTQNYLLNSLFQYLEIRCCFGKVLKCVSFPTDFNTFNVKKTERKDKKKPTHLLIGLE